MTKKLKNFLVIIPLHLPLDYPSDYVNQTARILAQYNKVILFDFRYPYSWKLLFKEGKIKTFFYSLVQFFNRHAGLVYFRPIGLIPYQKFDLIYKLNLYLGMIQFRILTRLLQRKVLVWGFDPIILDVIKTIGKNISVYDCVDFSSINTDLLSYKLTERKLFKIVNHVVFNSRNLYEIKLKHNPDIERKSFVAVCGCAFELFQKKMSYDSLLHSKGRNIILTGNFDFRLNLRLLEYLLKTNKDLNFFLIGNLDKKIDKSFSKLSVYSNFNYLGKKGKSELPKYYHSSDVGIIPYNTSYLFVKYSNPMKAYEYLACGLPVVSTKIFALADYPKDVVFTSDDYGEFSLAIRNLLVDWNNKKRSMAKQIAKDNSWENKISLIEKFIIDTHEAKT